MRNASADLLEFESLRELLGQYVGSPQGREELRKISPQVNRVWLEEVHALTAEAIDYLKDASRPQTTARGTATRLRFSDLADLQPVSQKLRIEGAVLEGKEIFDLLALADRAMQARSLLVSVRERYPRLASKALSLGELHPLIQDLSGKILPDGSLSDEASPSLHRLRRAIERQKKAIQESLERFVRAHRDDGVLQEDFITLRNERFVVPVVQGQQGRVQGVIHGSSASGHTLFLEPLETIHLNNEMVRLREEELREEHRILREITSRLRRQAPELTTAIGVMGELDLLFAKASFALDFDCAPPRFASEQSPVLKLEAARHPLLENVLRKQGKTVVPVSFTLDASRRTLLLSGPNTGGKTVTLKTVGLLALMAQSGIPVPARAAEFPVFDQVLADLGDNQSIAESLSSFSAHIRRIREMLSIVTSESLVLLDELGRATDPEEGGALGVAILEHFRQWRAFTLASTHLLALKLYGATCEGVANASMGFNRETLEPTYVLRIGVPGESAGLEIASRLGMPPDLIARARAAMTSRERDLVELLSRLQLRIEEFEAEKAALEHQRLQLAEREKQLAGEWERKEKLKLRELEQRLDAAIEKFTQQSRETLESMQQAALSRKALESAERKVNRVIRELRQEFHQVMAGTTNRGNTSVPSTGTLTEGCRVRLKNVREPARVRRLLGSDRLEVEAGFVKMQVCLEDVLEVLPPSQEPSRLPANVSFQSEGPKWDVSYRELNVIGKRAEEALEEVDRFLDQAIMASVDRVRIVHGHGMGVLKRAIGDLLSKHPHVAKHYPASPGEGGSAATIAELK
ncbi:MAG: Smr/MutS family protein [Bryobacteraceae bacterium]|nr:Smr/MutS family protein [Bryobacteraceae bacterium]MDW8377365.1 Smr/MutS family protein [Bryobacterales bacterium]